MFVAGGIGRGEAILSYLEMGAAGVQLGTRFVCAHESIAHPQLQARLHPRRGARRGAVGAARRALSGDPGARAGQPGDRAVPRRCSARSSTGSTRGELSQKDAQLEIEHFWAGALRRAVIDGDVESGSLMAGQSVGLVTREQSTAEILAELVDQALAVIAARRRPAAAHPDRRRAPQGAGTMAVSG